jgi:hypothetical protein
LQHVIELTAAFRARSNLKGLTDFNRLELAEHYSALQTTSRIMQSKSHACPPWTVRAWPPVLWQVDHLRPLLMRHLGTRVTNPGDQISRTAGQTIWAAAAAQDQAGMAWDWIQLSGGVVAMADPLSVVTNLRLISADGDTLSQLESLRHLNEVVHRLPWQGEVERVLMVNAQAA